MEPQYEHMVGRAVEVWTGGTNAMMGAGLVGPASTVLGGIVEDVDEGFLYLTQPDGSTACVPLSDVRRIRVVE